MPSAPFFAGELDDSKLMMKIAAELDSGDESEQELADMFMYEAAEPLLRRNRQDMGPEKLSLERLRRENAERGFDEHDLSSNVYKDYGFRLSWLPDVIAALQVPQTFKTSGKHEFTGEEGVLILLRRFRSTGPLLDFTRETGRNTSALCECLRWMVSAR